MTVKVNLFPNQEQSLLEADGPTDEGNGNDAHAPIGRSLYTITVGGNVFNRVAIWRELIRFNNADWAGVSHPAVYKIVKATLWLYTTNPPVHIVAPAAFPHLLVQQISGAWSAGDGAEGVWLPSAHAQWPGPAVTGPVFSKTFTGFSGVWVPIVVTPMLDAWAPATVKQSDGSPGAGVANRGLRLKASDEASASQFEFYSMRGGTNQPYIELEYGTNTPPGVPIITAPHTASDGTSPGQAASRVGTFVDVPWILNDPQPKGTIRRRHVLTGTPR